MIQPQFELTDDHGRPVTIEVYTGQYLLVFFGFTHCRVVCPRALSKLSEVLGVLKQRYGEQAEIIQPLYISVDPERDSPEVMLQFLQNNYPLFTGLTGTQEQVEAAKQAFHVFAQKKPDDEDPAGYAVPHTAFTYLLDQQGHYLYHYPDHWDVSRMVDDLTLRIIN